MHLIKADDSTTLGEWLGFCKTVRENRKMGGCGWVVVKDDSKDSQAKDVTKEYFKCKK